MRFNLPEAKRLYSELAHCTLPAGTLIGSDSATTLINWLGHLSGELGLPTRLRDMDIPEDAISKLARSEEHTSELQSRPHLVCRLLLEKKKKKKKKKK